MNENKHAPASATHDDPMPSTSDFVKKLYKMLEDPSFQSVVSWGPQGDCFVVKDMNEFTKSILPRMFKHSNFASFVRQLNKYDFHKVKNTDDNPFGEHSWTFRHPDFHADRRDALENIKRKVPAQRKAAQAAAAAQAQATAAALSTLPPLPSTSTSTLLPSPPAAVHTHGHLQVEQLQLEVRRLRDEGDDLKSRIRALERHYESVLVEMVAFQRGMAQQDSLMQSLIAYFLGNENGKLKSGNPISLLNPQSTPSASILPSSSLAYPTQAQSPSKPQQQPEQQQQPQQPSADQDVFIPVNRFLNPINDARREGLETSMDLGKASLMQLSEISRRASNWSANSGAWHNDTQTQPPFQQSETGTARAETLAKLEEIYRGRMAANNPQWDNQQQQEDSNTTAAGKEYHKASQSSASAPSQHASHQQQEHQRQQPQPAASTSHLWNVVNLPTSESTRAMMHEGLQVYTVGHLLPRNVAEEMDTWGFPSSSNTKIPNYMSASTQPENQSFTEAEARTNTQRQTQESVQRGGGNAEEIEDEERVMPTPLNESVVIPGQSSSSTSNNPSSSPTTMAPTAKSSTSASKGKLRVRRSTFVPGWAVPPRVLLVDDDAVSRRLGSKFLQVFGCTIDVAVDGVSAVNKMNLEKYDLVLMDIVMPKLDGVSATSLIRQFDHLTPIISMTSNSKPSEIMTYYSSGMNDILPKPFTQDGLFEMLEKHLMHMKAMQRMNQMSRSIGVPPLSDSHFEQAVTSNAANMAASQSQLQSHSASSSGSNTSSSDAIPSNSNNTLSPPSNLSSAFGYSSSTTAGDMEDETRINPLSGMGLTDEQYNLILQNIVNGENFMSGMDPSSSTFSMSTSRTVLPQQSAGINAGGTSMDTRTGMHGEKRGYEEAGLASGNGREKRSRFEVIE